MTVQTEQSLLEALLTEIKGLRADLKQYHQDSAGPATPGPRAPKGHPEPASRSGAAVAQRKVAVELVEWWQQCWAHHRGGDHYVPARKDFVAAAQLLKEHPGPEGVEDIKVRAENLIEAEDRWYQQHASIPFLRSRWNQLSEVPR